MPRWPEDSRERLIHAALELFAQEGYSKTTVEEIARAAQVSPRTFFRHFPDKEEVLFADDDQLLPVLLHSITADHAPVRADDLMATVLGNLGDLLEPNREQLRQRQQIVDQHVALAGRDLAKQGQWQLQIAEALARRGFTPDASELLAAIGFALFRRTLRGWLTDTDPTPLRERVRTALPTLHTLLETTSR